MAENHEDNTPKLYPLPIHHSARGTTYLHSDGHIESVVDDEGGFSDTIKEPSFEGAVLYREVLAHRQAMADQPGEPDDEYEQTLLHRGMFAGEDTQAAMELYQVISGEDLPPDMN